MKHYKKNKQAYTKVTGDHHHLWHNSPFGAITVIGKFCQVCLELGHPVFISLNFTTIVLQSRVISLAFRLVTMLHKHT
jgi:hypothetical protein